MSVVRCACGQKVCVVGTMSRCDGCGRIVRAVALDATEPAAEVQDFLDEPKKAFRPPQTGTHRPVARRMLEALLDPAAIRWLLVLGGTLSVIGLIVWAYSKRLFDSPWQQAAAFGVGTGLLFAVGWWLTLRTRHKTAGVALTFLAGVVAPLNLWFYHAQNLLTVDGHLWAAGLVCCGLYAATILALRRPVFLHAFQIGATLTVLLLLGHLGEVGATGLVVTLTALGATAIHLERVFPRAGDFDRNQFGPPLLWSGLAQIGIALAVLALVQGFAWSHIPEAAVGWLIDPARLVVSPMAATGLWLTGAYVALYLAVVPRFAGGWTILVSTACLLMAETTVLIGANATAEGAVIALGLTSAVACVAASRLPRSENAPRAAAVAGSVVLAALPVFFGYLLLARGTMPSFREFGWYRPIDEVYALAMTLVSACLAASAVSLRGERWANAVLRFLTAGAVLLAAAGTARLVESAPWSIKAALLTLIPLVYLIEGTLRKDKTDVAISHTAFGLFGASMFLAVCHRGFSLFIPHQGSLMTLGVAVVAFEFTIFLMMAAARCGRSGRRGLEGLLAIPAAGAVAMTLWQGLSYIGLFENWHVAVFAATALMGLAVARFRGSVGSGRTFFATGVTLLLATVAVTDFKGLILLTVGSLEWRHLGESAVVIVATAAAAVLAPNRAWRTAFYAATGISAAVIVLLLSSLADLTGWQRAEVLCVVVGLMLLVAGHVARFRETREQNEDLVDFALWVGGLLVTGVLAATAFYHRFNTPVPSLPDELALVTLGLLMLSTGVAFRFKSTTLYGGAAVGGYIIVLLVSLLRRPEVTMGAYLAGAGAVLFFAGVALSVYRDRLLTLPDRFAKHEGVFRILDWR